MLSAVQQQIQKFSGTLQAARPANSFQYNAKAATRSLTGPVNDIFTRSTFSAKFAGAGSVNGITASSVPLSQNGLRLLTVMQDIRKAGNTVQPFFDLDGTLDRKRWKLNNRGEQAKNYEDAVDIETSDLIFRSESQDMIRRLISLEKVDTTVHTARDWEVNPGEITPEQAQQFGIEPREGKLKEPLNQVYHLMPVLKELMTENAPITVMTMMGAYVAKPDDNGLAVLSSQPKDNEKVAAQWIFNTLVDEGLLKSEAVKDNPLFYKSSDDKNAYLEVKSAALCYHGTFVDDNHPLTTRYMELMEEAKEKFKVDYEIHNSGVHGVSELEAVPSTYNKGLGLNSQIKDNHVPFMFGDSGSDVAGGVEAIKNGGYFVLIAKPKGSETLDALVKRIFKDDELYAEYGKHEHLIVLQDPAELTKTLSQLPESAEDDLSTSSLQQMASKSS